jgi:hypothetical protein
VKTEVKFMISNPLSFAVDERYDRLGISACIEEGKLISVKTVVEHEVTQGHDEIIAEARARLIPLLTLIEYSCGVPANLNGVQTQAVEPTSGVSIGLAYVKLDGTLFRSVPMPPVEIVENLAESTRLQMMWYALGHKSTWAFERIKYFYMVLEKEEKLTKLDALPYRAPQAAKYLRDAVSHPEIRSQQIIEYLEREIHATQIDLSKESHVRFLERNVSLLQSEAERILNSKVPQWW